MNSNKTEKNIANPIADGAVRFKQQQNNGTACRAISSEVLFAGARELVIEHGGDSYRLRLTNQGKLILTK